MSKYEEIATMVEGQFDAPEYLEQKITYVKNKLLADVCVSANHTLGDYLILGTYALKRSIEGVKGDILVYNESAPASETIGVAQHMYDQFKPIKVNSSLYMQLNSPVDEIFSHLYTGKHQIAFFGITISMLLMVEFSSDSSKTSGIPQDIMSQLTFENFDDTIQAQENAYILIKKMAASTFAGIAYSIDN